MAGDWIKLRKDLPSDPAVIRMADLLGLDTFSLVGRLAAVWAWADSHADSHGAVTLVSRSMVDTIAQKKGFGAAMEAVGWLETAPDGLGGVVFPRFERHMGAGAKGRALAANRQEKHRNRRSASRGSDAPVTQDRDAIVTQPSPEKRREEKTNTGNASHSCGEPAKPPASPPIQAPPTEPPVMIFPCVGAAKEWPLTAAKMNEWVAAFPSLSVLDELRKARQWLNDNPGRRKTATGMTKFLGGWLGRSQDRGGGNRGGSGGVPLDRAAATSNRIMAQIQEAMQQP